MPTAAAAMRSATTSACAVVFGEQDVRSILMLDVPKKVLLPHGANFDDDGCRRWRGTTQTLRCLFPGKSHFVCVIISSHQPELFPPFFRPSQTSTSTLTWCTCIPTCWICLEPPPPPASHISPVSHILCVLSSVLISLSCFPLFSGRRRRRRRR